MSKSYRWCLLAIAIVGAVKMDTLTGQETADGERFIKSNRVTTLADMEAMTPRHRSRRAVTLTSAEKKLLVDKHNTLRRQEGASNMEHMVSGKQNYVSQVENLLHEHCLRTRYSSYHSHTLQNDFHNS